MNFLVLLIGAFLMVCQGCGIKGDPVPYVESHPSSVRKTSEKGKREPVKPGPRTKDEEGDPQ